MTARAAYLFGSGISFASQAPTVAKLTTDVFERSWIFGSDQRFHPAERDDDCVTNVKGFLNVVKGHIEEHLLNREGRNSHYEDLYSAVIQIVQDEMGDVTNPLIAGTVDAIKVASTHFCSSQPPHIDNNYFASTADRAGNLIQWCVYHNLNAVREAKEMGIVSSLIRAADETDIFTLNHDLLLESQFAEDGIDFADGFGERHGDVSLFDWSWKHGSTRLYKLHGSINWVLFRRSGWDQFGKVPPHADMDHCKDEHGNFLNPISFNPTFLTGTIVKEQAYGVSLIGELFAEFRSRLRSHDTLFCCGYGWCDNGINIRLEQWLRDAKNNRIIILHHGSPDELRNNKFWRSRWDDYLGTKLHVIPKWLSECALADLASFFH